MKVDFFEEVFCSDISTPSHVLFGELEPAFMNSNLFKNHWCPIFNLVEWDILCFKVIIWISEGLNLLDVYFLFFIIQIITLFAVSHFCDQSLSLRFKTEVHQKSCSLEFSNLNQNRVANYLLVELFQQEQNW